MTPEEQQLLSQAMTMDYRRQYPAEVRRQYPNPYFKYLSQPAESGIGTLEQKSGGSSAG